MSVMFQRRLMHYLMKSSARCWNYIFFLELFEIESEYVTKFQMYPHKRNNSYSHKNSFHKMIIWVACWKGRRERREALFVIKESFQKSSPE